jgi:hypothetical protein
VLENLVSHYSGELPGVEPNSHIDSEVASMEVTLESPQHQTPNSQMASTIHHVVSVPEQVVSEHIGSEQIVPEQAETLDIPETISEPDYMITSDAFDAEDEQLHSSSNVIIQSVSDQPSTSNPTHTSTNSQPSSSSLAIQPITPAKPNIPSPPTLFLDSTILADVCENIG